MLAGPGEGTRLPIERHGAINMDYLLVVQAPAYPLGPERFAIESAFAVHLKMLLDELGERFDRIVLMAPTLDENVYQHSKRTLAELSAVDDRIVLFPVPEARLSIGAFWRSARPLWRRMRELVKRVGFVHTGLGADTYRPSIAMLNLAAWMERKPLMFFIDIDFRQLSQRSYKLGIWGRKSYIINRVLHDKVKLAQVKWAIRKYDLVMLKSRSMVADLGGGRENVRFFLDAAHSDCDLIENDRLEQRLSQLGEAGRELQVVYFGRLVPYKGCKYMIEAINGARRQGAAVSLTFIGDGESLPELEAQVKELGLQKAVNFLPPTPYGKPLFDLIDKADLAIASPTVEDTPRAALDAMARGLPILAFDIDYFKSLAEMSDAVALASWPDPTSLTAELISLDKDRARIATMARRAVVFARNNSQNIWLQRRVTWTFEALDRFASKAG